MLLKSDRWIIKCFPVIQKFHSYRVFTTHPVFYVSRQNFVLARWTDFADYFYLKAGAFQQIHIFSDVNTIVDIMQLYASLN